MNDSIDRNFHTIYIDKIPIEEQISIEEQLKGYVYGAWSFMDKADIREWLTNDEVKIYNLQSKIDKAYDYLDKFIPNEYGVLLTERQWNYVKKILKEDK